MFILRRLSAIFDVSAALIPAVVFVTNASFKDLTWKNHELKSITNTYATWRWGGECGSVCIQTRDVGRFAIHSNTYMLQSEFEEMTYMTNGPSQSVSLFLAIVAIKMWTEKKT